MKYKKHKRAIPLIVFCFILMSIIFKCIASHCTDAGDTKITITYPKTMNSDWQYNGKTIHLPIKLKVPVGMKAELCRFLPHINDNEYLCITSSNQSVEVCIGDEVIYRRGYDINNNEVDLPGSFFNIIKLPDKSSGKKISISFSSKFQRHSGEINTVSYGTKSDIILNILKQGIYRVAVIICLDIIAMICFGIVFFYSKKHRVKNFINLGMFCMIVSVWVFTESGLSQFFCTDQHVVKMVTHFCIMLAPIPINLFLKDIIHSRFYKSSMIFSSIYLINFAVNVILESVYKNIFESSLIVTHIIIVINCIITFYALMYNFKKQKDRYKKYVILCMTPIIIASVAEIVGYYVSNVEFYAAKKIVIGFAISIVYLVVITIMDFASIYKQAEYTNMLNMLAFEDTITKGKNRTAFYRDIDEFSKDDSKLSSCIMVLDLNDLKKINDVYGHTVGDEAIKLCYDCVQSCIQDYGTCYRIGGDEFVAIFTDCSEQRVEQFIRQFDLNVNSLNDKLEYDFNVAYGYSFFDSVKDKDLMDAFNRADKLMYSRKKLMKEK